MTKTAQELDDEYDALIAEGESVEQEERTATQKKNLWHAKCYVWWSEAKEITGYLDKKYEERGIANNKTGNRINFRPVLKLLTEHKISSPELTMTSKALNAIDDAVINDPEYFKDDKENKIAYYIKSNHGITGLAGYHDKAEHDDDEIATNEDDKLLFTLDDDEFNTGFLALAKAHYPTNNQLAINQTIPLNKTADGYSLAVMLDVGSITLIDTIDDAKIIHPILLNAYRNDLTAAHNGIRTIVEPLHILSIPYSLAKQADKYREASNERDPWDDKRKRRTERKFTYRAATKDILYSYEYALVSPVVLAKPKGEFMPDTTYDLFLQHGALTSAEINLLALRMLNAFEPVNEQGIRKTLPNSISFANMPIRIKQGLLDTLTDRELDEKRALKHIKNLSHPSFSFLPYYNAFGDHNQVAANPSSFNPTWTANVSLKWLKDYRSNFSNRWIAAYGTKAKRDANKFVKSHFTSKSIITAWEYEPTLGYAVSATQDFEPNTANGTATLQALSVDYVFILHQISTLPITSLIELAANDSTFRISFSTSVADYEVWLTACNEKGVRDKTHFTKYIPTQDSRDLWANDEEDDKLTELTKKEENTLTEQMLRLKEKQRNKNENA